MLHAMTELCMLITLLGGVAQAHAGVTPFLLALAADSKKMTWLRGWVTEVETGNIINIITSTSERSCL